MKGPGGKPYHKFASFFPQVIGEEREAMKRDIAANGVRNAVLIWQGQLVDGRNRWEISQELGLECPADVQTLNGKTEDEVLAFVVSNNLNRRHLTSGQKAAIVAELGLYQQKLIQAQAKKKGGEYPSDELQDVLGDGSDEKDKKRIVELVAEALGTNKQYVYDAEAIKAHDPALLQQVKTGEVSISKAKKMMQEAQSGVKPKPVQAEEGEPTDKLGSPLTTAGQVKAFDESDWFKAAKDALSYAKKIVKEIRERGGATHWLLANEIESGISEAYRLLGQAEPYAVCPYCKDEKPCDKKEGCRGTRWVTRRMYESKPGG